jgi:primosomal protein N' (replication factor Y)
VLVQTFSPGHPAIQTALRLDDGAFFAQEMAFREALSYPPVGRLVALRCEGPSEAAVRETAETLARRARALLEGPPFAGKVSVLGPAEAPLVRLHGQVRYQMLLRGRQSELTRRLARELLPSAGAGAFPRGVRVIIDVDPVNLL